MILDTPPINIVIDACILAKYTSGVIYVIKQDYAKKDQIIHAVRQLEFSQGKVIGFVLNDITDKNMLGFTSKYKYKIYRYGKYRSEYAYKAQSNGQAAVGTGTSDVHVKKKLRRRKVI